MATIFTISSKDLLHPGNNPQKRLDAEGCRAIAALSTNLEYSGAARELVRGLTRSPRQFHDWIVELRKKTKLKDVENHITRALIGGRNPDKLSDAVKKGIHKLAINLCSQEKELIKTEIADKLKKISQFEKIEQEAAAKQ